MTDIFLSYSSKDRERVRPFQEALAASGYKVFWDIETPSGQDWDQWIRGEIAKAAVVVVFWSQSSVASRNVRHEVAIAHENNKLVPALLETMNPIDFPMGFYTTQAAAVHDWDGKAVHAGYAQLIRTVRQRLEVAPAQTPDVVREQEASLIRSLRKRVKSGDVSAQTDLAYRYATGQGVKKDYRKAFDLYRLAAEQGEPYAQSNLGLMYEYGRGLAKDERLAAHYFELAAKQGLASAQSKLAYLYSRGIGVRCDKNEALRLYTSAAIEGDARAQCNLGAMYELGEGVEPNDYEAVRFYRMAAEQGDPGGQASLAEMIEQGRGGLEKNLDEALRLYRAAKEKGDVLAFMALKRLGQLL